MINSSTGLPMCSRCSYLGCPGGLAHFKFLGQLKLGKLMRAYRQRRYEARYAYIWVSLSDVEVDGLDGADYPDFCDAYISSATISGRPATDAELDYLNEDREYVNQLAHESYF